MSNKIFNFISAFEEFLSCSIDKLRDLQNLTDLKSLKAMFIQILENNPEMYNENLIKDFVEIIFTILKNLRQIDYFSTNETVSCCIEILSCVCNLTDNNEKFVIGIIESPLLSLLISNIVDINHATISVDDFHFQFLNVSLSIIHNITKFLVRKGNLETIGLKAFICDIIDSDCKDPIRLISMMILSSLVNENDLHLLEKGRNTLKTIIKMITKAYSNNNKRYIGYSVWELMLALENISANDDMKKKIVEENGVEIIISILNNPFCEKCMEKCLGIIWNLCFDENIRIMLLKDFNLLTTLDKLKHHDAKKIRKLSSSIIWYLEKVNNKSKRNNLSHQKFDVFLSYSWLNKSLVLSIYEKLIKSNIRVWIDEKQMKSSVLDDMSQGIENSTIFVVMLSDSYRVSPNCRSEAEYAFSLRKPIIPVILELKYKPKGWLGMIIGNKVYYEFSERRDFDTTVLKLQEEIKSKLENTGQDLVDHSQFKFINSTESSINLDVKLWSCQDVEQ